MILIETVTSPVVRVSIKMSVTRFSLYHMSTLKELHAKVDISDKLTIIPRNAAELTADTSTS